MRGRPATIPSAVAQARVKAAVTAMVVLALVPWVGAVNFTVTDPGECRLGRYPPAPRYYHAATFPPPPAPTGRVARTQTPSARNAKPPRFGHA